MPGGIVISIFFIITNWEREDPSNPGRVCFPFECIYDSIEALYAALQAAPVKGFKVYYKAEGVYNNITKRELKTLEEKDVREIRASRGVYRDNPPPA